MNRQGAGNRDREQRIWLDPASLRSLERRRHAWVGSALVVVLSLGLVVNSPGSAENRDADATPAPDVGERSFAIPGAPTRRTPRGTEGPSLDALLQLPSGFLDSESRTVAGAGERVWRSRFVKALSDVDEARVGLDRTKRELDEVAEGGGANQWSMAPPGGGSNGSPSTSPLSFKLRQELKDNRARLEDAERAMRALRIEAELAGVPESWRGHARPARTRAIPN